jgi:hypothetical protein
LSHDHPLRLGRQTFDSHHYGDADVILIDESHNFRNDKSNRYLALFQAPHADGQGRRHFWRYIDAGTHEVQENRYEIARVIACPPEEPRYIGEQDVFGLQDKVVAHILAAEREAEARAAAPTAVDSIQQTVTETIKDAIRRRIVDRDQAKACITFLGQPMGKALHTRLRTVYEDWGAQNDDRKLVEAVFALAEQFGKDKVTTTQVKRLTRDDLELICFEYVSS